MSDPTRVSILGATGSIGTSTLRVLDHNPGQFSVVSVVAQRNVERLKALKEQGVGVDGVSVSALTDVVDTD